MSTTTKSVQIVGSEGFVIDIEAHLTSGLPSVTVVGMTNKSVDESRERLRGAFSSSGLQFPRKRIIINLAPADIQKLGSGFDVAIAAALLKATQPIAPDASLAYFGELGLDGTIRPVRGIIGKLIAARDAGLVNMVLPAANLAHAQLVPHVRLLPVASLKDLYDHFSGVCVITPIDTGEGSYTPPDTLPPADTDIADVVGQERAKRALLLAAAGGHNLMLNGPPGMGKSMLARTLPGLLPHLSHDEALLITHLHSLGAREPTEIMYHRPFRAPHHSASTTAIVGGGQQIRPGEITLAHGGVLFLDEMPEFRRSTIESLRQPLEDGVIQVSRARETVTFPADCMLIATKNPCPCGYYGSEKACTCSAAALEHYKKKLSGPIEDRIDLHVTVEPIQHEKLLKEDAAAPRSVALRELCTRARFLQAQRYEATKYTNATVPTPVFKRSMRLTKEAETLLNQAAQKLRLSARVYIKSLRIARTIADVDAKPYILAAHIAEALQYRP